MTKKDYIKIADVLKRSKKWLTVLRDNNPDSYNDLKPLRGVQMIIDTLCTTLQADNPRFDRDKFIDYINKAN